MASMCGRASNLIRKLVNVSSTRFYTIHRDYHYTMTGNLPFPLGSLCAAPSTTHERVRYSGNFISGLTTEQLWNSVIGLSTMGRKRGRGKTARRRPYYLYAGKHLGRTGPLKMQWPGLNTPVYKDRRIQEIVKPEEPDTEEEVVTKTDERRKRIKVPALQRGYSGGKLHGMKFGPPDPIGDYTFPGFESICLQCKVVHHMTALGRSMRFKALVVTGNGNGLAGFDTFKDKHAREAIKRARNKAAQRLQYFERYQGHTVYHNFYAKSHSSAIFVRKEAKGYGLRCKREIRSICEMIGIKDLHAKIEGNDRNILEFTKAFFKGLDEQETHQKLADRVNLHVVEFSKERNYMPVVVASPTLGAARQSTNPNDEDLDFERLYYGDRVPLAKKARLPFYYHFSSHQRRLRELYKIRNQPKARLQRVVCGLEPEIKEIRKGEMKSDVSGE